MDELTLLSIRLRRVHAMFRMANVAFVGAFEEISDWNFREQLEVNFFGTANIVRTVLPGMRKRRSGHIINITGLSMSI